MPELVGNDLILLPGHEAVGRGVDRDLAPGSPEVGVGKVAAVGAPVTGSLLMTPEDRLSHTFGVNVSPWTWVLISASIWSAMA